MNTVFVRPDNEPVPTGPRVIGTRHYFHQATPNSYSIVGHINFQPMLNF